MGPKGSDLATHAIQAVRNGDQRPRASISASVMSASAVCPFSRIHSTADLCLQEALRSSRGSSSRRRKRSAASPVHKVARAVRGLQTKGKHTTAVVEVNYEN